MNRFKKMVMASLLVAIIAPCSFSADMAYKVGDTVEPFHLKDAEGTTHDLGKLLGEKIIVLDFWNCQCPVSQSFENQRKSIVEKYGKQDVVILAVDSNSINSPEKISAYSKEKKLNYTVLKDDGNKIADKFDAAVTPEVFVIGKDKKIHYHGAIANNADPAKADKNFLADALDALIAGKTVEVTESKAFGCGIKRAK